MTNATEKKPRMPKAMKMPEGLKHSTYIWVNHLTLTQAKALRKWLDNFIVWSEHQKSRASTGKVENEGGV